MIRLTDLAEGLPASVPFTGPETLERRQGRAFEARLGANENGFGPSPRAIAAMERAVTEVWKYGDPESADLRAALADYHGVTPRHIVIGEGIDGLLGLLVRLLVAPGDRVVTSDGAYPTFNYHVTGFGGHLVKVPYADDHEDLSALIEVSQREGARLIYFANPDNPMGTWRTAAEIVPLIDRLAPGQLLILDEAYAEMAPPEAIPPMTPDDPRVIRMRTFSKAYGLAGARIGYAIAHPDLIAAFDRVRNHFGVNRIAQAGALAALADQDWVTKVLGKIARSRDTIAAIGRDNGLIPLPSATNFVALDCGGRDTAAIVAALGQEGVFIRSPGVAPLNRCIRISCGPEAEMAAFARALPKVLACL